MLCRTTACLASSDAPGGLADNTRCLRRVWATHEMCSWCTVPCTGVFYESCHRTKPDGTLAPSRAAGSSGWACLRNAFRPPLLAPFAGHHCLIHCPLCAALPEVQRPPHALQTQQAPHPLHGTICIIPMTCVFALLISQGSIRTVSYVHCPVKHLQQHCVAKHSRHGCLCFCVLGVSVHLGT